MTDCTSKYCPECKQTFPLTTQYWHKHKGRSDGFQPYCKTCRHRQGTIRYSQAQSQSQIPYRRKSTEERFWNKVKLPDMIGTNECWEWIGFTNPNGYGHFGIEKRPYKSHRVSYELAYGPIPDGMLVCHSCDNRACVNPAHLWLGTAKDNVHDMIRKGRANHKGIRRLKNITPAIPVPSKMRFMHGI